MSRAAVWMGITSIVFGAGCSGAAPLSDELESASAELRIRNCTLLETCPSEIPIAAAVDFGEEVPDDPRPDVTVADDTAVAHEFQRRTFGPLTAKQPLSLTLTGAGPTDSFTVDDVLLVEVLDAQTTESIAIVSIGWFAPGKVLVNGVAVTHLGASASLEHAAGSVDIGPYLPMNRSFNLRVTALDTGGTASISKIVGRVAAAATAPPAPPAVDPFDPASCSGPALTRQQALAYFRPASSRTTFPIGTTFHARERRCNQVTGCAEWATAGATRIKGSRTSSGVSVKAGQEGSVVLFLDGATLWGALRGTKYDRPGYPGYSNTLGAIFPIGRSGNASLLQAVGDTATTGGNVGSPVNGTIKRAVVTASCVQIVATMDTFDPKLRREVAWFGHL